MTILLLGSGGREHAFAWKIHQSPLCTRLLIAPGNPGTAAYGTNLPLSVMDTEAIVSLCIQEQVDMVVIGPEDPLVNGLADILCHHPALPNLRVVGPSKHAAQLEGSKAFAKAFMSRYHIPTASYREFSHENYTEGLNYLKQHSLPLVLKADGLAAGKGVVIAESTEAALMCFQEMIQDNKFGKAGNKVVVESFLKGIECSVFVLTDGQTGLVLPVAKDYKRIGEGDTGLNTGGMGAISPVPFADELFLKKVQERIINPTLQGIQQEKLDYVGFIFIGLMAVDGEPYVIEYNCRMGDPETEAVLPRIQNDLVDCFCKLCDGQLSQVQLEVDPRHAATVMLVSKGYPEEYQKGLPIQLADPGTSIIFHAGTVVKNEELQTQGGRVMALTSLGHSLQDALQSSYQLADKIQFEGKHFRRDIGWEFRN